MSFDRFLPITDAILAGDVPRLLGVCDGLDEQARSALEPAFADALRVRSPALKTYYRVDQLSPEERRRLETLTVAQLCLSPAVRDPFHRQAPELAEIGQIGAAIAQRSDEWRTAWTEQWRQWLTWSGLRQLIRAGVIPKPKRDYAEWLARAMTGRWDLSVRRDDVYGLLLEDPGLLEDDVFLIFDLGFLSYQSPSREASVWDMWGPALARLAAEGRVSRTRLLDACLTGIENHPLLVQKRNFAVLHNKLKPTIAEVEERQAIYLRLLESEASTSGRRDGRPSRCRCLALTRQPGHVPND